jgi:hypothetical protein
MRSDTRTHQCLTPYENSNRAEPNSSTSSPVWTISAAAPFSNTSGRCGKPKCHCHQPGQPVHGPNPRLTCKVQGKTITESLPTPAAQKKAEREIAEFRRSEDLIREFVAINAKICQVRSAEDQQSAS